MYKLCVLHSFKRNIGVIYGGLGFSHTTPADEEGAPELAWPANVENQTGT